MADDATGATTTPDTVSTPAARSPRSGSPAQTAQNTPDPTTDPKTPTTAPGPDAPRKGSEHGRAHHFDWHNIIEALAFLVGLTIFLYPLIASYVNYYQQSAAIDNYDAIVDRLSPKTREKMWKDAKAYDIELGKPRLRDPFSTKSLRAPLNRYWKTLDVDGHGMMAYVEIPKINVKLPVYHGTSDSVLAKGTGHIATTHLPTDNKTVHSVITGHTGLVGHIFFDNLTQVKKGDTFEVRVLTHHLTYKVDSITVIWPTQVKALQPVSGKNYVTLLTCTPYGVNDHRLLVRGHFIGESKPLTKPDGLPLWFLWLFLIMVLLCVLAEMWCRRRRTRNRLLLEDDARAGRPDGSGPGAVAEAASQAVAQAAAVTAGAGVAASSERTEAGGAGDHGVSEASADGSGVTPGGGSDGAAGGSSEGTGRLDVRKIRRHMRWQLAGIWVFSILAVFFAWASFGMMMRTGFLPAFDLGYSWWDSHVTYWFSITGMQHLSMPINW